ncbi:MAG: pentapeptide repeat-containing protein [Paracoccaceae bacterium]|nr:pentapeptide repeat-containing protein [Paracoccaceae bacterium]
MTDQDHLDRINALTHNARSTWFALLAALVFVGITLMGVEHIDFYGVDRATQLPLVNVEVPTRYFFVAAPILIAAIYGYFHLYLIRLWDALGAAPARINGIRLGDAVTPWLVTDAALHFRRRMRRDNSTTPRTLEGGAMLLNFLLAWGFGLIILYFTWQLSMPARTFWMTAIAAICFAASIITGASSIAMMARRMRRPAGSAPPALWATGGQVLGLLIGGVALLWTSHQQTEGPITRLAHLDLSGENIVERPAGWLSHGDARAEFRADWCRREAVEDCSDLGTREAAFAAEFERRRDAAIADMRRPDWHVPSGRPTDMDFRNAILANSFLTGANLSEAQMEGAFLWGAQMEGAFLWGAQMEGANLSSAQMEGADLWGAQMEGANLSSAQMEGADLWGAQMEGADLRRAQMEGADLRRAQMEGADLRRAQMERAMFDYTRLTGVKTAYIHLQETNLSMSTNHGGMLRFVDLTGADFDGGTDFRNAFLDGSVRMTDAFRQQMGDPCQWHDDVIEDDEIFYGRWRGWIEVGPFNTYALQIWESIAPEGFEGVEAIEPDQGCTWKTGPMPDTDTQ